ncbi:hypothetical protein JCM15765_12710 [Paradesulfitobacterium aromaticivorans]
MFPLALSIGGLAGIWTFVSGIASFLTWPAFVGWALFFAGGGDSKAIGKSLAPGLLGIVLGFLVLKAMPLFNGGSLFLAVGVAVIAFIMVMVMSTRVFAFAPAAFAGCAVYFGANGDIVAATIPFVLGILLGYVSAVLPNLAKNTQEKKAA